jgi:hypothetical protein
MMGLFATISINNRITESYAIMLSVVMLSKDPKCRILFIVMLILIMLILIMLILIMLILIMLDVIMLTVIMLSVVMLNVVMLSVVVRLIFMVKDVYLQG